MSSNVPKNLGANAHGYPGVEEQEAPPRPYWIGLLLLAFGAIWIWGGMSLPQGARYAAVGPGLFPTLIGVALVVLGAILLLQIHRRETFQAQSGEDVEADAKMDKRAFLTALVAVAIPMVLMKPIGMPLTATLSFMLVANALGSKRWLMDLAIGAVLATAAWWLFRALGLNLGPFLPFLGV